MGDPGRAQLPKLGQRFGTPEQQRQAVEWATAGMHHKVIAARLGFDRTTIEAWLRKARKSGIFVPKRSEIERAYVLGAMADGVPNRVIAGKLGISTKALNERRAWMRKKGYLGPVQVTSR